MKFEKMKLPVLTGMRILTKYNPQGEVYLSSVRPGIACLVMNGKVCDTSGIPFKNAEFQDYFKEFAERAMNCKTIAIGNVIDITAPYKELSHYDMSDLQRITYDSKTFSSKKDNIKLELEDVFSIAAQGLEFKQRHTFLNNMIVSIATITKKKNVEMQSYVFMDEYKKEEAAKFALDSAKRNEYVVARDAKSIYKQGSVKLNEVKSFILNQFEEFEEPIKTITFIEENHLEIDKAENHIKAITVLKDDNLIKIDYMRSKPSTRRFLYKLIVGKKLSKIKFESVHYENEYKFSRPS